MIKQEFTENCNDLPLLFVEQLSWKKQKQMQNWKNKGFTEYIPRVLPLQNLVAAISRPGMSRDMLEWLHRWRIQYSNDAHYPSRFTTEVCLKLICIFIRQKDCLFCSPHNIRNVKLRHTCKLTLILNCLRSPRHHFFSHWQNRFPLCQV